MTVERVKHRLEISLPKTKRSCRLSQLITTVTLCFLFKQTLTVSESFLHFPVRFSTYLRFAFLFFTSFIPSLIILSEICYTSLFYVTVKDLIYQILLVNI